MPLFSIVTPTHNRALLLDAMLESVWAQVGIAPDDIEVVVVDDGSTDETRAVLERHQARYPARLKTVFGAQSGPGAARNRGLEIACGTYVCFLDSDDLWFAWSAATYARLIEEHQPSLILGRAHEFGGPLSAPPKQPLRARVFADYLSASGENLAFGASAIVARRDALGQIGGFTDRWINAEDLDLVLRLGTAPGLVCVESPAIYAYRKHDASALADLARTVAGVKHLLACERAGRYPGGALRRQQRAEILARVLRFACLHCAQAGDARHARLFYRASLGCHLRQRRARFLLGAPLQIWAAQWGARPK